MWAGVDLPPLYGRYVRTDNALEKPPLSNEVQPTLHLLHHLTPSTNHPLSRL